MKEPRVTQRDRGCEARTRGVLRDADPMELLAKRLKDRDAEIVRAAARALGCLGKAVTSDALLNERTGTAAANRGAS